ncbi:ubiquitin 3 binding protein But2 C-terminal domain-containing protein [Xylaria intraflava]|nr:ubiquitin 3 binding protein But2 C-terminal domain-containing protein [Xylaria intraflava]
MFAMLVPLLVSVFWPHSSHVVEAQAADGNVGCAFHLSCSGGFNGSIGEKSSGQARAGRSVSPMLFTWFGDAFADQAGSGCWWTPPTYTLQCDKNQTPDHGFSIGCDGALSFNGQSVFYECPTGVGDEVNVYLRRNGDQCHEMTIQADSCAASTCPGGGVGPGGGAGPVPGQTNSPTSSAPATLSTLVTSSTTIASSTAGTPSTVVTPSTQGTSSTSQGPPIPSPFTTGNDQTTTTSTTSTSTITTTQPAPTQSGCIEVEPDQIILTDQGNPDTAYGPNSAGHIQISPNASSIFNFHFDDADLGKICELTFRMPPRGTPYNLTGTALVTLAALEGRAAVNTTYNSAPRILETLGDLVLYEGMQHGFGAFPCPGSSARGAVLLAEAPLADTCLDCLQGNGVGMVLRKC